MQSIQKCLKDTACDATLEMISLFLLEKMIKGDCDLSNHRSTFFNIFVTLILERDICGGIIILINDCLSLLFHNIQENEMAMMRTILSKVTNMINKLSSTNPKKNYSILASFYNLLNCVLHKISINNSVSHQIKEIIGGIDLVDTSIHLLACVEEMGQIPL